jgi:hypothetical protein
MKKVIKILQSRAVGSGFIVIVHFALLYWLAERDTVAVLFAAGDHVPIMALLLAVSFLCCRLMLFLGLPAILLWLIAKKLWDRSRTRMGVQTVNSPK